MDLNHETAMRLWVKSFGKQVKAIDFAGREMLKGAYNDRNSRYGWNVDHVLPQSKGGATADYNLVCCNIQTNDEKADKFPCFYANGNKFEIIKVQNHYEIKAVNNKKAASIKDEDNWNFYDSASGIRFFKKSEVSQSEKHFVGYVLIKLNGLKNAAIVDFIEELFTDENILCSTRTGRYYSSDLRILVVNYNMPLREDSVNLLNKCMLLNTYFSHYFLKLGCFDRYEIQYSMKCYENKMEIYKDRVFDSFARSLWPPVEIQLGNTMFINELVAMNTAAKDKIIVHSGLNEFNYIYTKLSENLIKEVEAK